MPNKSKGQYLKEVKQEIEALKSSVQAGADQAAGRRNPRITEARLERMDRAYETISEKVNEEK